MARTLFLLLVLLNMGVFAWIYSTNEVHENVGREPQRLKAEMAADRIRLLSPDEVLARAASARRCVGYSAATASDATALAKTWTEKLPDASVTVVPVIVPATFDVAIVGLATRAAADTKLAELKKLGVADGVRIRADDDTRFSVLIASSADRKSADEALKEVAKKGVRSASVVERRPASEKSTIEVRGNESALQKLPELAAATKALSIAACGVAKNTP